MTRDTSATNRPYLHPDLLDFAKASGERTRFYHDLDKARRESAAAAPELVDPRAFGLASREEWLIPGDGHDVRVWVYLPVAQQRPLPVGMYLHGGAFVMGSLAGVDRGCADYAVSCGIAVVSVDYRLAPEHPFPAAIEDAAAVYAWLVENAAEVGFDPERIALMGSSAGATLAAGLALYVRDHSDVQPAMLHLNQPALDDSCSSASSRSERDWPVLNRADQVAMWELYLRDGIPEGMHPYAAPARGGDFKDLPPTYICAAGADLLCEEAIDFVCALQEASVSVEFHIAPGACHGFHQVSYSDLAVRFAEIGKTALSSQLRRKETPEG